MNNTATAAPKTTQRKTTTTKPRTTKPKVVEPVPQVAQISANYTLPNDPLQQQALVDSYWTLRQAGAPIPDAIRIPVEDWITNVQAKQQELTVAKQTQEESAASARAAHLNVHGPTYVRNVTNMPFNFRLERQQEGSGRQRRIELKPRGVPGDMHPLKDEDEQDPMLITNLNMGLIELIPAGEANLIIEKQTTNMSTRVHTPSQILKNEYKILRDNNVNVSENPTVRVEAEFNSQGVTVATIDPTVDVNSGKFRHEQLGNLQRGDAPTPINSQYIPTGGNPTSISFDPLAHNRIQDDIARRKDIQGPAAGLGDIKVTVEPTRRA